MATTTAFTKIFFSVPMGIIFNRTATTMTFTKTVTVVAFTYQTMIVTFRTAVSNNANISNSTFLIENRYHCLKISMVDSRTKHWKAIAEVNKATSNSKGNSTRTSTNNRMEVNGIKASIYRIDRTEAQLTSQGSTDKSHHHIYRINHIKTQLTSPITVSTVSTISRLNWWVPSPY